MRRFLEKDCRGLSGDLACDPSAPRLPSVQRFFRCRPVSILRWIHNEWNERIREAVAASVRLGCVIVSGLSLGTDTCAHTAAPRSAVRRTWSCREMSRPSFRGRTGTSP